MPTGLVLRDTITTYNLIPFLFHTRDASRDLSARELYVRFSNQIRGERQGGSTLNLSFDGVSHWYVADITNQSSHSKWVIDFGKTL